MSLRSTRARQGVLLASVAASVLLAGPAFAASVTVANGETHTAPDNIGGTDIITVDLGGTFANPGGRAVFWNADATGGGVVINNAGTLGTTANSPVAGAPGVTFDAAPGIASSPTVTGLITINNSGLVGSQFGPGIVFGGSPGSAVITNLSGGQIAGGGGINVGGTYIDGGGDIAIVMPNGPSTLSNFGRIDGDVLFGSDADTLNVSDTTIFNGRVDGGDGLNTLNLGGAGGQLRGETEAPFSGAPDGFLGWDNFQTLNVNSGLWTLVGKGSYDDVTVASGATLYICQSASCISAQNVMVDDAGLSGATGNTVDIINNGTIISDHDNAKIKFDPNDPSPDTLNFTGAGSIVFKGSGTTYVPAVDSLVHMTGTVTVDGGTFILATTLGGNVVINPGATLQIGSGGNLTNVSGVVVDNGTVGDVLGNIADNGVLIFNRADDYTFAGGLSGDGSLVKMGPGLLTLSGQYSYTGTTSVLGGSINVLGLLPSNTTVVVDSGVLNLGAGDQTVGGLTGTGGSVNVDSGQLTIQQDTSTTYAGAITGGGSVALTGSGVLTLAGANTYSGSTTVTSGTLNVTGSLPATTDLAVNGGVVALNGSGQTVAQLSGDGGQVQIGAGVLTVDQSGASTYAGSITGGGALTLDGGGVLNLTGDNTYTGPTTVDSGLLKVNGSIVSNVVVGSGGVLGGSGSVGGDVSIGAGGTIAPGNSPGLLTVAGNFTFASGSTYQVQVQPGASPDHDQIDVVGAGHVATIASGAAVQVQAAGVAADYGRLTRYTILTAAGGVSGAFDASPSLAGALPLKPYLVYSADEVDLVLLRTDITFASLAATANQVRVANAVEAGGFGTPLFDALLVLDAPGSQKGYDALSGEIYASAPTALIEQGRYVRQSVLGRMDLGANEGLGVWGKYLGGWARRDAATGAAGVRSDLEGFVLGADRAIGGEWRVGAAGAFGQTDLRVASRSSRATAESVTLSAYAGGAVGPLTARIEAAYAWHSVQADRVVAFTGFNDVDTAQYSGHSAEVFGEVSHRVDLGDLAFEPFAGVGYVRLSTDPFHETGGASALQVAGQARGVTLATAGMRASDRVALSPGLTLTPHVSVAWRGAYGDLAGQEAAAFAATSQAFTITGAGLDRKSLVIDAGLDLSGPRGGKLSVSYSGVQSNRWQDNAIKIGASWTF